MDKNIQELLIVLGTVGYMLGMFVTMFLILIDAVLGHGTICASRKVENACIFLAVFFWPITWLLMIVLCLIQIPFVLFNKLWNKNISGRAKL
ncbi:hypothetical protein C4588_03570 [Candidatus Parcubacteria bacterium]|nr:MAG: hypothetical protein C4588_03570 [Candidatus Parcubacteria bacterium]